MLLDEGKNVLWNRVYPELAGLDTDGLVISEQADGEYTCIWDETGKHL